MERGLRFTFGDRLVDQEFKFTYENNHPTITIQRASALAINPWIVNKLEIAEVYGDQPYGRRYFRQSGLDASDPLNTFLRLGADEYRGDFTHGTDAYWLATTLDKPIHWFLTAISFQTIYIYSDIVASQMVGDVRANILRAVAPRGNPGEIIHENVFNLFYHDVRLKSFNTIEILLRGDTGEPIPFLHGVVEVTLHFRKKR